MSNIMLVDDSDDFRKPVASALRRRGYNVTDYTNGPDALAALKTEKPDLVILDMVMATMDGMTVLRTMRNQLGLKVPVLVLTGRDSENVFIDAKALGAYCLLKYCITIDELCTRVRDNIAGATRAA